MGRRLLRFVVGLCTITVPMVIFFASIALLPRGSNELANTKAGPVRSLAWSADGRWIAAGSDDGRIRLWNTASRQLETVLEQPEQPVYSLAFSPDSARLAAGQDTFVRLWDLNQTNTSVIFTSHTSAVNQILWSEDGQQIGSQDTSGQIILWDVASQRATSTFNRFAGGLEAALALGYGEIETVSLQPAAPVKGCNGYEAALNNAAAQQKILKNYAAPVNDAVQSPDYQYLAVAPADSTIVTIWNITTGARLYTTSACDQTTSLAWSPDSQRVALGKANGQIIIWNPFFKENSNLLSGAVVLALGVAILLYWLYFRLGTPPRPLSFV